MSKYVQFEYVFDKYHYGIRLDYYSDWKCFQIAIFCFILTINFSGNWAGSWKNKEVK